jgi:hypothetical protein
MPKDRSLVRASDIGAWAFCNRAWWLATVQNVDHENPTTLVAGDRAHYAHNLLLAQASKLQRLGLALLAAGMILGGILLLIQLLTG